MLKDLLMVTMKRLEKLKRKERQMVIEMHLARLRVRGKKKDSQKRLDLQMDLRKYLETQKDLLKRKEI